MFLHYNDKILFNFHSKLVWTMLYLIRSILGSGMTPFEFSVKKMLLFRVMSWDTRWSNYRYFCTSLNIFKIMKFNGWASHIYNRLTFEYFCKFLVYFSCLKCVCWIHPCDVVLWCVLMITNLNDNLILSKWLNKFALQISFTVDWTDWLQMRTELRNKIK